MNCTTVQTSLWKQHRIYTFVLHNDNYEYIAVFSKSVDYICVMLSITTHNKSKQTGNTDTAINLLWKPKSQVGINI